MNLFRQMGMHREAEMIENQIKMRGNAPGGQAAGMSYFLTANSELFASFSFAMFNLIEFFIKLIFENCGCSVAVRKFSSRFYFFF